MDTDLVYMSAYMLIRKVFGCGLDAAVFKRHYELLSLNDQQVLERVERVAWRMMVADILRLRIRFRLPFDLREVSTLARFNDSELPSLELFYLFGCLDTLAGSDHLQYPEWLKQESKAGRGSRINGHSGNFLHCRPLRTSTDAVTQIHRFPR